MGNENHLILIHSYCTLLCTNNIFYWKKLLNSLKKFTYIKSNYIKSINTKCMESDTIKIPNTMAFFFGQGKEYYGIVMAVKKIQKHNSFDD